MEEALPMGTMETADVHASRDTMDLAVSDVPLDSSDIQTVCRIVALTLQFHATGALHLWPPTAHAIACWASLVRRASDAHQATQAIPTALTRAIP